MKSKQPKPSKLIRIDREVYEFLRSKANGFEPVGSVVRRLLGMSGK